MIRGSAVNNDGPSAGLTVPSADGAGERPAAAPTGEPVSGSADVQYVELHGTGTPVGDPIEAAALGRGARRRSAQMTARCAVGSVKTNIGHLEGAAGIAGLIKTALAIERGQLPASLNFERPTRRSRSTSSACGSRSPWRLGRHRATPRWPASAPSAWGGPTATSS